MYLLFRIIDDECNPKNDDLGSESPEDEEDFKLRIPEVEELSDDEMKTAEGVDEIDEEMYKRFVANDARRSVEDKLFGDIEEEEDLRRERLKDEKMLQSPDESLDLPQEDSRGQGQGEVEATFTAEPLENLDKEAKEENTAEDKTFCCKKHSKVFSQEKTSIRMCATKQLFEQVSCDEPYVEEPRDTKTAEANRETKPEVLTESELNAHEADIRGKLLNKRRSMNPSKVCPVALMPILFYSILHCKNQTISIPTRVR